MQLSRKRRPSWVAALSAAALVAVGLAAPGVAAADVSAGTNVALAASGAQVSASGTEGGTSWTPGRAVDGITAGSSPDGVQSRWSSNHADDAWIQVELAEPTVVDHVTIYWEAACAAEYTLQVSSDGTTWTDATADVRPVCGSVDRQSLAGDEPVSFVRMQASERTRIGGGLWGVSLWELEVWDGPEPTPVLPEVALVPQPVALTETGEAPYVLEDDARIVAAGDAAGAAEFLATLLRASTGYDVPVVSDGAQAGDITLAVDAAADFGDLAGNEEAYTLTSGADGVAVVGASDHAVFNGVQTLRQLLPAFVEADEVVNAGWTAPAVEIVDGPRYAYRGMMLDVARSFLTVEEVKDALDTMAAYKISRMHFHIADDQGWRIEITNEGKAEGDPIDYSLLTEVSGRTAMTQQGYRNELGRTGYYTQDEYADIVAYAADLHIEVVPEIDIPGHTNAALHAIPELNTAGSSHAGTPDQPTAPFNGTGSVGYSYLDPYAEISYTFVEHVLTQLAAITPGDYLHIGGDESHLMTAVHGHEGYVHFVARAVEIVHDLGKKPIGWNEYAEATLNPGDAVHYWIGGTAHAERAITQDGAKAILSRGGNSYLDMKYNAKTPIGLTWACSGTCDFPQYYGWDPATVIPNVGDENILGNEAPMWAETIRGGSQLEFLAFPRAISHAEIGWTPQAQRDVAGFATRIAAQGERLLLSGSNFYDGNKAAWEYSVAGTDVAASPARELSLDVGLVAAPGTKVSADGTSIAVDVVDDADGVSASALVEPLTATVTWGDGTQSAATFTTDAPRDSLHAGSVYTVEASHAYAAAGSYTGSIEFSDGSTADFTARIAAGTPDPTDPPSPWDPDTEPGIAVEESTGPADGRVRVEIEGFVPGEHVLLDLGGTAINSLLPRADGSLEEWLWIPAGAYDGEHELTATQGAEGEARTASTTLTVTDGRIPLPNPIPRTEYSIAGFSSEETAGEDAPAAHVIDGDPATFWHSRWSSDPDTAPQHLTIDLGGVYDVEALEYTPRPSGINGMLEDYAIYVSADPDERGDAVAEGTLGRSAEAQIILLPEPAAGRYVTLEFVSAASDSGGSFATAGEIRVGGLAVSEVPTVPGVEVSADTRCVAGRVVEVARVANTSGASIEVSVGSAFGSRTTTVAPDRAASATFSTRQAAVAAGEVSVGVSGEGIPAGSTVTAEYAARACG